MNCIMFKRILSLLPIKGYTVCTTSHKTETYAINFFLNHFLTNYFSFLFPDVVDAGLDLFQFLNHLSITCVRTTRLATIKCTSRSTALSFKDCCLWKDNKLHEIFNVAFHVMYDISLFRSVLLSFWFSSG